jgi:hypothetical protein
MADQENRIVVDTGGLVDVPYNIIQGCIHMYKYFSGIIQTLQNTDYVWNIKVSAKGLSIMVDRGEKQCNIIKVSENE